MAPPPRTPLIPGPDGHLELMMLGTIISAVAYGVVVVLSGNCVLILRKQRGFYSNGMRLFLLIYVNVMFLLSTLSIIQSTCGITLLVFGGAGLLASVPVFLQDSIQVMLPLTIWGADGFMIWRCFVLYQEVSRGPRILIIALLFLLSFLSSGCGIMMLLAPKLSSKIFFILLVLVSVSTLVNIIFALLIALRLIYHQRYIRRVFGVGHGSPYFKVITMCVESSALIVIFSSVYTVLAFKQADAWLIPYLLLPHLCHLAPPYRLSRLLKVARPPRLYSHRSERLPRFASTTHPQGIPVKRVEFDIVSPRFQTYGAASAALATFHRMFDNEVME